MEEQLRHQLRASSQNKAINFTMEEAQTELERWSTRAGIHPTPSIPQDFGSSDD